MAKGSRQVPSLAPAQYADLSSGAREILEAHPPDTSFYLGVGQTTGPLVAFLQNLGGPHVARYLPSDGLPQTGLSNALRSVHGRYLRPALPPDVRRGERELVLFQHAFSPEPLRHLASAVRQPFPSVRVRPLLLTEGSVRSMASIDVRGRPLLGRLQAPEVRELSPYPFHRVGESSPDTLRASESFRRLRRAVAPQMQSDAALRKLVDRLNGASAE
jgi:hypothetical protein